MPRSACSRTKPSAGWTRSRGCRRPVASHISPNRLGVHNGDLDDFEEFMRAGEMRRAADLEKSFTLLPDLIGSASAHIGADYFQLPVADADAVYRERVYCYELYHQLRCLWKDFPFSLGGEIDKQGNPHFHRGPYAVAFSRSTAMRVTRPESAQEFDERARARIFRECGGGLLFPFGNRDEADSGRRTRSILDDRKAEPDQCASPSCAKWP